VEAMHYLYKGIVPDLIISDLMMENITGHEFIKHIQSSAFYCRIPIIILSGVSQEELSKEYADVFIVNKPFDPLALQELVDTNISKTKQTAFASNN
jgi:CheY-like chemotaxis protein